MANLNCSGIFFISCVILAVTYFPVVSSRNWITVCARMDIPVLGEVAEKMCIGACNLQVWASPFSQ